MRRSRHSHRQYDVKKSGKALVLCLLAMAFVCTSSLGARGRAQAPCSVYPPAGTGQSRTGMRLFEEAFTLMTLQNTDPLALITMMGELGMLPEEGSSDTPRLTVALAERIAHLLAKAQIDAGQIGELAIQPLSYETIDGVVQSLVVFHVPTGDSLEIIVEQEPGDKDVIGTVGERYITVATLPENAISRRPDTLHRAVLEVLTHRANGGFMPFFLALIEMDGIFQECDELLRVSEGLDAASLLSLKEKLRDLQKYNLLTRGTALALAGRGRAPFNDPIMQEAFAALETVLSQHTAEIVHAVGLAAYTAQTSPEQHHQLLMNVAVAREAYNQMITLVGQFLSAEITGEKQGGFLSISQERQAVDITQYQTADMSSSDLAAHVRQLAKLHVIASTEILRRRCQRLAKIPDDLARENGRDPHTVADAEYKSYLSRSALVPDDTYRWLPLFGADFFQLYEHCARNAATPLGFIVVAKSMTPPPEDGMSAEERQAIVQAARSGSWGQLVSDASKKLNTYVAFLEAYLALLNAQPGSIKAARRGLEDAIIVLNDVMDTSIMFFSHRSDESLPVVTRAVADIHPDMPERVIMKAFLRDPALTDNGKSVLSAITDADPLLAERLKAKLERMVAWKIYQAL